MYGNKGESSGIGAAVAGARRDNTRDGSRCRGYSGMEDRREGQ